MFNTETATINPSNWILEETIERCKKVALNWTPDNTHYISTEEYNKLKAGTHRYIPSIGTVPADIHWSNGLPYVMYDDRETGTIISAPSPVLFSPNLHAVHSVLNNGTECMLVCTREQLQELQILKTIKQL